MRNVSSRSTFPRVFFFWTTMSLILFYGSNLFAEQVTFAWDANSSSPDGYRLFMRTEGQPYNYNSPVWTGKATTCTVDQLENNAYYFVVRAYVGSNESLNSNEVEYKVVVNNAPRSNAGTDQAVSAGARVTLDGSGSSDSEGTISKYQWTQTSGPSVSLRNAANKQSTFTAPNVTATASLNFRLTVTDDGGLTDSDTCQVTVLPVANGSGNSGDSDNDGLSDAEETGIYGTDPHNPDTDGDGILDGQEVSNGTDPKVNGSQTETGYAKIWMEAEDGDVIEPIVIMDDSSASGSGYIVAPEGSGILSDPSSRQAGYVEYTFDISSSGDYLIWGRVIANDNASDSFFVKMDDGQAVTWHTKMGETDTWTWDVVSSRNYNDVRDASSPLVYHLKAGTHTLKIQQREDGTQMDRLLITNDKKYIPEGKIEPVTSITQKTFWLEAEKGTIIAPMEAAGGKNSSGGGYLVIPEGAGMRFDQSYSQAGYAEYTFDVSSDDDFVIWGRVIAADDGSNSFFIMMDNGEPLTWHTIVGSAWTWDVASQRNPEDTPDTSNPLVYHLKAGTHKLRIQQREDGAELDRILITNDISYVPLD